MPIIDVYNTSGTKTGKLTLPKEIFDVKINPVLMTQVVRVHLSNLRQAPAKTKRRGEISLSGKKIYRQKGTGGARHGDRKAPIFVKGGKAHGPTGEQNYHLKISRKMKKQALFSSLTSKLKDKEIVIIDGLTKIEPKTKKMAGIINKLRTKNQELKTKANNLKFTLILPSVLTNVLRAGRNMANLNLVQVKQLNTYEVLNGGKLIFMKDSIAVLKDNFLKEKKKNADK